MRVLVVMVLLGAVGCAHNPLAIDTEVRIEITLTSPNYVVGEPVGITLANKSPFPVWMLESSCPHVQVFGGNLWSDVRLNVICPQDAPGPRLIATGESIARSLPGWDSNKHSLLEPGRYRVPFSVARPSGVFKPYYSPEFQVSDAANTQRSLSPARQ